jgi:hypothetical protein
MTTVPPDAWARDRGREHAGDGWRLWLPIGVTGGPVPRLTNPGITSLAVFRGWVEEHAMAVFVTTRARSHSSLRAELRELTRHFSDGATDGIAVELAGARGARRADGWMDVEEGYGHPPDWTERVTLVGCGHGRRELVIVTLRRHPAADIDDVVARIVDSLGIIGPS